MAEHLENGCYTIRYVPEGASPPFVGGVYATATGINKPIRLEASAPGEAGKQIWRIHHIRDNTYHITLYTLTREAPHGFAPSKSHPEDSDGIPVVDSQEPAEWRINKSDMDNVWSVILPWEVPMIGATRALFNKEGILGVKAFPIVPGFRLPTWEFRRTTPNP